MLLAQVEKLSAVLASLRATYAEVDQSLAPLRKEWGLKRREQAEGVDPNGAFYGLQIVSGVSAEPAIAALRAEGLPAQWCGAHDPHHFASWVNFLDREQRLYRLLGAEQSDAILRRSVFLELKLCGM